MYLQEEKVELSEDCVRGLRWVVFRPVRIYGHGYQFGHVKRTSDNVTLSRSNNHEQSSNLQ